jgi:hypothetical protein
MTEPLATAHGLTFCGRELVGLARFWIAVASVGRRWAGQVGAVSICPAATGSGAGRGRRANRTFMVM